MGFEDAFQRDLSRAKWYGSFAQTAFFAKDHAGSGKCLLSYQKGGGLTHVWYTVHTASTWVSLVHKGDNAGQHPQN